jgi:hypothetical protein
MWISEDVDYHLSGARELSPMDMENIVVWTWDEGEDVHQEKQQ